MRALLARLRPILALMAAPAALGALLGLYPGYKAYDYTWRDAGFCVSCHVHDYASTSWKESAHGRLTTCHDCHHQPLRAYMKEMYLMAVKPPKFPRDLHHIPNVPRHMCESCHTERPHDTSNVTGPLSAEDIKKIPKIESTRLHAIHLRQKTRLPEPSFFHIDEKQAEFGLADEKAEKPAHGEADESARERVVGCVDCHGTPANRAHHFTAADQSCLRCHGQTEKNPHGAKAAAHGGGNRREGFTREAGCRGCHFQDFMVRPQ